MLSLIQQILGKEGMSEFLPQQQNSFLLSLMTLSAYMISADGIVMQSELDYISRFLDDTYGADDRSTYMPLLHDLLRSFQKETATTLDQKIEHVCQDLTESMTAEERRMMVSYLTQISLADKHKSNEEVSALSKLGKWLNINTIDL